MQPDLPTRYSQLRLSILVVVAAGCSTADSRIDRGGWHGKRYCQFSLCDGHCCDDRACWTVYCSAHFCASMMPAVPVIVDPARVVHAAAGSDRTCVLTEAATVRCWGNVTKCDQPYGYAAGPPVEQFSDSLSYPRPVIYPADLPLAIEPTAIAVGNHNMCALGRDRTVQCWGNGQGAREAVATRATQVAVGFNHSCVLVDDGQVLCWGWNQRGLLGTADSVVRDRPQAIFVGKRVLALAAGDHHTCAVTEDHHLRCWGEPLDGALGYGNTRVVGDDEQPASAGDVPLGEDVERVVSGSKHTCALVENGRVRCWGSASSGQLGTGFINTIGDDEPASASTAVPLGGKAVALAAGAHHTCALLDTGSVRCWGLDADGQLGYGQHERHDYNNIGDNEPASAAGDVPLGESAVEITAGSRHTCAVLRSGALRCWGRAQEGQLGYHEDPEDLLFKPVGDDETPAEGGNVPFAPNWEPHD